MTLTYEDGKERTIVIRSGTQAAEFASACRALMLAAGFHPATVNDSIPDPYGEEWVYASEGAREETT